MDVAVAGGSGDRRWLMFAAAAAAAGAGALWFYLQERREQASPPPESHSSRSASRGLMPQRKAAPATREAATREGAFDPPESVAEWSSADTGVPDMSVVQSGAVPPDERP